jgi:hypothetical protein
MRSLQRKKSSYAAAPAGGRLSGSSYGSDNYSPPSGWARGGKAKQPPLQLPIQFVNDHDIDEPSLDISQKQLKLRAQKRGAGMATIIIMSASPSQPLCPWLVMYAEQIAL